MIYADNAATTRLSDTAKAAMLPYFDEVYGNPSSLHTAGRQAKQALESARHRIAACLGAEPSEIFFTSGGSESDNQALITAAEYGKKCGKRHLISTAVEHHAVLNTLNRLRENGFEVTLLPVDHHGLVTAEEVKAAIRPETAARWQLRMQLQMPESVPKMCSITMRTGLLRRSTIRLKQRWSKKPLGIMRTR